MTTKRIPVVCAVIQSNDLYLLCKRPPGKKYAGLWEFPGGKVEPGESFNYALRREMQEELEIAIAEITQPLAMFPNPPFDCYYLGAKALDLPVLKEHTEYGWFPLTHINSLSLIPSGGPFVNFLLYSAGLSDGNDQS